MAKAAPTSLWKGTVFSYGRIEDAAVAAGFLAPVKFLVPDMRVFWLAEGDMAATMPVVAGICLAALWLLVGCISLEKKELE